MQARHISTLALAGFVAACAPHVDEPVPWPVEVFPEPLGQAESEPHEPSARAIPSCPRRGGRLEVLCDDKVPGPVEGGRLRSHTHGCLTENCQRLWRGPDVPNHVALTVGTQELTLVESTPEGDMALYRDPYGAGSCSLSGPGNCEFTVRIYDASDGRVLRELRLNDYISRPDHIEVQDAHFDGGVVYFNEACQSYSQEAGRKCSALVAVDASTGEQKWRTRHLVSNGYFAVLDDYVAVSYGFTAETPSLSLVDKARGKVAWTTKPPGAAHVMERVDGTTVFTRRYSGRAETFEVRGGRLARR